MVESCASPKLLPVDSGNSLVLPYKSSILIFSFLGIASNPKQAIKISCIVIIGTVFPLATYVRITLPAIKPTTTPILPNLFKIPATKPEIAYAAIIIGSVPLIIPNTTPIVIPPVAPTNIPFFQPSTSTIKILKIFLILKPNMLKSPKAHTAIDKSKLVPITSSIVKAFLFLNSFIIIIEFANIL